MYLAATDENGALSNRGIHKVAAILIRIAIPTAQRAANERLQRPAFI